MPTDLYNEGELSVKLEAGRVVIMMDTKGADFKIEVESDYFLDKLKDVIPGTIDDSIIEILKVALKGA